MKFKDVLIVILIVVVCIFIYDKKKENDNNKEIFQMSQEDKNYEKVSLDDKKENPESIKHIIYGIIGKEDKESKSVDNSNLNNIISKVVDNSNLIDDEKKSIVEKNLSKLSNIILKNNKKVNLDSKEEIKRFENILNEILENEEARDMLKKSYFDFDKDKDGSDLEKLKDSLKNGADISYSFIKSLIEDYKEN